MTVWKFPLVAEDLQIIKIPKVYRPLTVQVQGGLPFMWAAVDDRSNPVSIKVRTFGTGHPGVEPSMDYVGSYQLSGGALVFHVFIEGRA